METTKTEEVLIAQPRCYFNVGTEKDRRACGKLASHEHGSYPICADHVFDAQQAEPQTDPPTPLFPYVGMPATICYYSDRHPATVVYVSKNGHKIIVHENDVKRVDNNGMSDDQQWEILGVNGKEHVFFRNGRGGYGGRGKRLALGVQEHYYDFNF